MINEARDNIQLDQESRLLRCALDSDEYSFLLVDKCFDTDFVDAGCASIFRAIQTQIKSNGKVSVGTVKKHLKHQSDIDTLSHVAMIKNIDPSEIDEYVDFLKETSRLRQIDQICNDAKVKVRDGNDISSDIISDLMTGIISTTFDNREDSFLDNSALLDSVLEDMVAKGGDEVIGYSSSLDALDKILGGIRNKKLYCVAARPGMGKTLFALQMAVHISLKYQVPVPFFSLEMPREELMERNLSNLSGVKYWKIQHGAIKDDDEYRLKDVEQDIRNLTLRINDSGSTGVAQIIAKCKALKLKEGTVGPIFIDYLGLMRIQTAKGLSMADAIGEITRALKEFAKDIDAPVILVHQLSRKCEERENKRPLLSDLRDSGKIEQDSDVCIFLYRDFEYTEDPAKKEELEIIVRKHRGGRKGTAYVGVDLECQRAFDKP